MPAHDILYKFVEELTGEPVDPSQYRPTFTGGMAALDAAIAGVAQERKDTISEAVEAHLEHCGGGGGSTKKSIEMQIGSLFYNEGTLGYLKVTIINNGTETVYYGNELDPGVTIPIPYTCFKFEAEPGALVYVSDTRDNINGYISAYWWNYNGEPVRYYEYSGTDDYSHNEDNKIYSIIIPGDPLITNIVTRFSPVG